MDGIQNGTLRPVYIRKIGKVHARIGIVGEIIMTKMPGTSKETFNIVNMGEDGLPDMVIKNKSEEEYAIPAKTFFERYDKDPYKEGLYIPKGIPFFAVQVFENITFRARWGAEIKLKANGFIAVRSTSDIYPIQREYFNESYEIFYPKDMDLQNFSCPDNSFSSNKTL
jgi:hypothetical protein